MDHGATRNSLRRLRTEGMMHWPQVVVVMGVSGKTTIGQHRTSRLGCNFKEGDRLHPQQNVEK
jgi:hypothetical protein